jgi:hypothetical protein
LLRLLSGVAAEPHDLLLWLLLLPPAVLHLLLQVRAGALCEQLPGQHQLHLQLLLLLLLQTLLLLLLLLSGAASWPQDLLLLLLPWDVLYLLLQVSGRSLHALALQAEAA